MILGIQRMPNTEITEITTMARFIEVVHTWEDEAREKNKTDYAVLSGGVFLLGTAEVATRRFSSQLSA